MKLLDINISEITMKNIETLFWHGNQNDNDLLVLGLSEGFELGLLERNDLKIVKPIGLSEKGYVMARAHYYLELSELKEMERVLNEIQDKFGGKLNG